MAFKKASGKIQSSNHPRIDYDNEIITRQKLVPLFADLKEFIRSTVRGATYSTETRLRKEINLVKEEVRFTQQALRATKEELLDEIRKQVGASKVDMHEEMSSMKDELREEMRGMESRLSQKIDRNNVRLDNHEIRITSLEQSRP